MASIAQHQEEVNWKREEENRLEFQRLLMVFGGGIQFRRSLPEKSFSLSGIEYPVPELAVFQDQGHPRVDFLHGIVSGGSQDDKVIFFFKTPVQPGKIERAMVRAGKGIFFPLPVPFVEGSGWYDAAVRP